MSIKAKSQASFIPRYPGDGYNHELSTIVKRQSITCPCGQTYYFSIKRECVSEARVVECSCGDWHVIYFHSPPKKEKPRAHLIICGKE